MEIFEAITSNDFSKAKNCILRFDNSLVNARRTGEEIRDKTAEFIALFESCKTPENQKSTDEHSRSTKLRDSFIVCGVAALAELARFKWCADDSWCDWMPPTFAATAGGNFAVAVTQLTDNSYVTGVTCVAACGIATLQHINDWKIPGFANPVAGNLIGFFGRKLLAASADRMPNDTNTPKCSTLQDYFAQLKSDEMRGLLSRYLSTVAYINGWSSTKDTVLLYCSALAHWKKLEIEAASRK